MFIGEKLLYLELPKTGCTHVRKLLRKMPSCKGKKFGKHNTIYRLSPEDRAGLSSKIKFGNVRNPWDWYVSLWAFGCMGRGLVYNTLTGVRKQPQLGGELFAKWQDVYRADDVHCFRRWLRMLLVTNRADVRHGFDRSGFSDRIGFMSHRYLKLYVARPHSGPVGMDTLEQIEEYDRSFGLLDSFVRLEFLEEDLLSVLSRIPITQREQEMILSRRTSRSNASSRRRDYRHYYDDSCAELVARKDEFLIRKHRYAFDGLVEPEAVDL